MYNGAAHLSACLESVSSQTVADFEAVLVDDGSTDGTVEMAENYSRRDSRFRLYRNQQNLGLIRNWCKAVDYAGGEWIKFLFQDDLLEPMCLEKMLSATDDEVSLFVRGHKVLLGPEINEEHRTRRQLYMKRIVFVTASPAGRLSRQANPRSMSRAIQTLTVLEHQRRLSCASLFLQNFAPSFRTWSN